jgi:hypothetical protein
MINEKFVSHGGTLATVKIGLFFTGHTPQHFYALLCMAG